MQHLSIYIHWPFCLSKCPYCDFNSHVQNNITQSEWQQAYLREIDGYKDVLQGKTIKTIFIGGGTPSLASPELYNAIFNQLAKYAKFSPQIEITIEANPTSVEAIKFKAFREVGINRVSLGIQSLRPEALKFLGREHSATEAKQAIAIAATYFENYSFDLIYARPQQTLREWRHELEEALAIAPHHLSLYQLTIEKGTKFFAEHRAGKFKMPEEELAAEFYELTQEIMESHGMPAYEISNHAKPGLECQHNLVYWRYGKYLGLGAGAHGRFAHAGKWYSTINYSLPNKWLHSIQQNGSALQQKNLLTQEDINLERVLMGMRITEGVPKRWLQNIQILTELVELNLLKSYTYNKEEYIATTSSGRLILNQLLNKLLS
jgi:oxygen-independent coproporphyrinogen-3 oxidase